MHKRTKVFSSLSLRFAALFFMLATFTASPAFARQSVPIVNYDEVAVMTRSGAAATNEQVREAIVSATETKKWAVAPGGKDTLLATLSVRGKHAIVVEITYSADRYSLTYHDSTNMNFSQRNGELVIHPSYNKWVNELKNTIAAGLLKI